MITALTWIPRGAARQKPVRYELSPEEYSRIKNMAEAEQAATDDEHAGENEALRSTASVDDEGELPAELRMDEYDDEVVDGGSVLMGQHSDDNAVDDDDEQLAVLEQGVIALAMPADEDDEDAEDDEIRHTDSVLVVAMTEDDFSHLEVQLLSEDGHMFVHHDITLPEFPLCLAWMDCPPFEADGGQQVLGNYIAVGSFDPAIEIWNLDVLDALEPTAVLGGDNEEKTTSSAKASKKKKKSATTTAAPEVNMGGHEDAVMGLSWNKKYRQALASSSADTTVRVWDVTTHVCQHTFTHHTDKVQSVVWHYDEAWLLASGSFDKTIAMLDCRTGTKQSSYKIASDVECMVWDPFCSFHLYCAMENGQVVCIDLRLPKIPFCSFQAHDKTTSSISFSAGVSGMFATASVDKTVKVWDAANIHAASTISANVAAKSEGGVMTAPKNLTPQNVMYKSMNVGKLFTMQFFGDDPFVLATAGDKGSVAIWESDESEIIQGHFKDRVKPQG